MMLAVDDLVDPAGRSATAALDPGERGPGHALPQCPPNPVSSPSRARERVGPVRRMLLTASAGGLVGPHLASREPHMP
jgi:hypothetical protein